MTVKFTKVTIHHFLSFDHAELDLTDKGYCLVSGVNKNPKDSAKSNGAGKSTIFNAISYVLTGETLQGLKSNLGNIYFNDGCWVSLNFTIDGHEYTLLRSKDDDTYGTNLKITVDGDDKSGKGIRESQLVLDQLLPDLTSELLGSVIMIGQGMPMKFTANTPAGRKEVLEHLSQSDFMIQDLKDRIAARNKTLADKLRELEDALLTNSSQAKIYNQQLADAQTEFTTKFSSMPDFDGQLAELTEKLTAENNTWNELDAQLTQLNNEYEGLNPELLSLNKEKETYAKKFLEEHNKAQEEYRTQKTEWSNKVYSLSQEIKKLDAITDICPTCGQRIPGAVKPDTTKQKEELAGYEAQVAAIVQLMQDDNESYQKIVEELDKKYDAKITELQTKRNNIRSEVIFIQGKINLCNSAKKDLELQIAAATTSKEFYNQDKERVSNLIAELTSKVENLQKEFTELDGTKGDILNHIEIIKKMTTIITRDFRGFLLKNIIEYINAKAKEYTAKIFGCDEIEFVLDGNNIDISFCNKDYENLSGGEKQRVDLIVQFAIRDFMSQYLQFSSNILVLDEITDALDAESCDKVINFITNELNDIESVFIISHHADELSIPVDSEVVVEKNIEGVSSLA